MKQSVPPSEHRLKYRLAYVVAGECVLRYDDERGKGHHRHVGSAEAPYAFSTPDQLMADFSADIARRNQQHTGRTATASLSQQCAVPDAIYVQNAVIDTAVSGNVVSNLPSSVTHLTCRSSARDMYSAS